MIEDSIHRYSSLLEEELFFEAHEFLEGVWKDVRRENKNLGNLLKGYINAATTFVLFQKGRDVYPNTWATYKKFLPLKATLTSQSLLINLEKADKILQEKAKKFKLIL
ncbi:MAG: DUF309 domain-containing protein [Campylobacterales bacterium]